MSRSTTVAAIFKACDIRGRWGKDLTPEVAYDLGRAVGSELPGRHLVVGGDLRPSTLVLKPALIDGLITAGCRVTDVGTLPTPAFYFAKDQLGASGGVMVTGSHNPAPDNGFKVSLGSWPVTEEELGKVARRMAGGVFVERSGGRVERREVVAEYVAFLREKLQARGDQAAPPVGGTKIVADAGNGSYSQIAPGFLRELGYEVVELFCEPDGTFPNRPPNPAVAANLRALGEAVVREGAAIGVAYDGDGDRVVFVDERGRVVDSDRSIVLLARYVLASSRFDPCGGRTAGSGFTRDIIFDIKCSSIVPEQVQALGGAPVMEKSGHVFIKTALLRRRAVFAGEISGHFFFGELGRDDGLYATAMMLRALQHSGRSLAELVDALPRYPNTPDLRLPCTPERARSLVDEVVAAFAGEPGCEVSTLDGARVAWPDGWALVRPSVTEPLITLRFEAHDARRLAEIQALVARRVPGLGELMAGD